MDGTNILHCNDGFWNASIPSYILSWHYLLYLSESCKPLPLLSNGKIHNNGVSHGAVVSFSCNSGFQPQGSLQIKCLDGIWNESSPSCIGPVSLFNPLHYHDIFFISITISLSLCIISFSFKLYLSPLSNS